MIASIILLALLTMSLGMRVEAHGKPRDNENGWHAFVGYVISMVLLYFAGFFDKFF